MEQKDNARFESYLQTASGDGMHDEVSGIVEGDEISSHMGGKFEEHEEHDEGEWKYIREEQQSEKQQQILKAAIDGIDGKDAMEGIGIGIGNGHGHGGHAGADDMLLLGQHEVGNGVVNVNISVDVGADVVAVAAGADESEEGEVEIIKNDGDFSTTSNTTSTAGDDADADADADGDGDADAEVDAGVLQVEMKIEAAPTAQLLTEHAENMETNLLSSAGTGAETEEEEPSSLATNTTNGTNSLSENAPHQLQPVQAVEHEPLDVNFSVEDKENADPLVSGGGGGDVVSDVLESARPTDLDFESHSQLNPNAMVFVPSFGSNPTSPVTTAPMSGMATFGAEEHVGEPACNAVEATDTAATIEPQQQPHPNALPRHLLGDDDDDFVAQSPRKGRGDTDLDCIALPGEIEFEHEAAQRPHELERKDDLIGDGAEQLLQQEQQLPIEQLENGCKDDGDILETNAVVDKDCLDYQRQSPVSFIDHGPETCVDLDAEADLKPIIEENLPQQICEKVGESIEHILNTVQPLPIDFEGLNASFIEESSSQQEDIAAGKELLDVEEKENISHSPSTEEMQMNLRNELHASAKDIPQIPIDMDNAANMQESFYLEHTSTEIHEMPDEQKTEEQIAISPQPQTDDHIIDDDFIIPSECNVSHEEISLEEMRAEPNNDAQTELETDLAAAAKSLNIFAPEFTPTQKPGESDASDVLTPSPLSTEEKHLVEETKEQQTSSNDTLEELEQKMDDIIRSAKDGFLSQVEEVAQTATHINENFNPFAVPESEVELVEPMPVNEPQDLQLHSDPLQMEQPLSDEFVYQEHREEVAEPVLEISHNDDVLLSQPALQQYQDHISEILSQPAFELDHNDDVLLSRPALELDHNNDVLLSKPALELDHNDDILLSQPVLEPDHSNDVLLSQPALEPDHNDDVLLTKPEAELVHQEDVLLSQPALELEHNDDVLFSKPALEPDHNVDVLLSQPADLIPQSPNKFEQNETAVSESVPEPTVFEPTFDFAAGAPQKDVCWPEADAHAALQGSLAAADEPAAFLVEPPAAPEEKAADDIVSAAAAIGAVAVGAVAATAIAVTAAPEKVSTKKPAARTPTSAKSKVGDVKKTTEHIKKSAEPIKKTARPSTAPIKSATSTSNEKKTSIASTTARLSTTTRKPLSTTTARPTATARPTTAPIASRTNATKIGTSSPTAARPLGATRTSASTLNAARSTAPSKITATARTTTTSSTVRRSAPAASTAATTKPKTTLSAPTKPTTLGISSVTNKTKLSSPRTTMTSQLRKTGPTGVTAAKSPIKSPCNNMNGNSSTATTGTNRAKTSGITSTSSAVTKTFTARPAPKTTHVTMTATHTVRRTTGGMSTTSTTTTTKTSSSTIPKRTPPNTKSTVGSRTVMSPTKTPTTTASKLKAKEVAKKPTPTKSAKQVPDETKMNGAAAGKNDLEEKENMLEQQPQLNGGGDGGDKLENGTHHDGFDNIGGFQIEQNVSLIDA